MTFIIVPKLGFSTNSPVLHPCCRGNNRRSCRLSNDVTGVNADGPSSKTEGFARVSVFSRSAAV